MKIRLTRQGNDLEVYIDELCIVVRDRYRRHRLFRKKRTVPLLDIDTLLSASKNLDVGETAIYEDPCQKKMMPNLDRAIEQAMDEIPKEKKRRLLNESINEVWPHWASAIGGRSEPRARTDEK